MTVTNRYENAEIYLNDIGTAIKGLVERCGGSLEDGNIFPKELSIKQRTLFVHSGIVGLMSTAVIDHNVDIIEFFDWLLGYYVNKDKGDQKSQDQFIVKILTHFHDQMCKSYPDRRNPRFFRFLELYRLSVMTLDGFVSQEEFSEIDAFCVPIGERCIAREIEKRQRDAEKN